MNLEKEKIVSDTLKYVQKLELQKKMIEDAILVRAEELKKDYKEYVESTILKEKEHQKK